MTTTDPANTTSGAAVAAPVDRHVRPDVERVMRAVWYLVRSGPNYDGRQHNVEAAIAAAIDRAAAAERESIRARLLGIGDAVAGRHNYYAHAAWVLFDRKA